MFFRKQCRRIMPCLSTNNKNYTIATKFVATKWTFRATFFKNSADTINEKSIPSVHSNLEGSPSSYTYFRRFYNSEESVKNKTVDFCKRTFRTSRAHKALPPIVWMVLRQVLKVIVILVGRGLRIWWLRLPKDKRQYLLQKIKARKGGITLGTILSGGLIYTYYVTHLVEEPITMRKRFLLFSEKQVLEIANIESEAILQRFNKNITTSGLQHNRVLQIARKIIEANRNLPGTRRNWRLFIIDIKGIKNAFVLPSGHIFIFTGMLSEVENDDQLAVVVGHEVAHALLSHSAELVSKTHLVELLMLLPILVVWTLLPDSIAFQSHLFLEFLAAVVFKLPNSRQMESEADAVGLEMIARACFDPRQASVFWRKMEKLAAGMPIEWFSTHPSHKARYEAIDKLLPEAFKIRSRHCMTTVTMTESDMDPRAPRLLSRSERGAGMNQVHYV